MREKVAAMRVEPVELLEYRKLHWRLVQSAQPGFIADDIDHCGGNRRSIIHLTLHRGRSVTPS